VLCSPYGADVGNKQVIRNEKINTPIIVQTLWDRYCNKLYFEMTKETSQIIFDPYGSDVQNKLFSKFIKSDALTTKNTNVN